MSAAVAALVVLALATTSSSAQDEDAAAKGHFDRGRVHYENGRFLEAAAAFEEAHRISQRSALLYNLYLAYRDANDTRRAAAALRGYLERTKEVENRPLLEAKLASMEKSLADEAAAPPPAAVPAAKPAPAPAPVVPAEADLATAPEEPPHKTDLVPFILMGGGGAMVIGSVVTGLMASSAEGELQDKCPDMMGCDPSLEDTQSRGETLALVTDILLFGGLAVGGTGVVLFLLRSGDESPNDGSPSASLACIPGACHAALRGKF